METQILIAFISATLILFMLHFIIVLGVVLWGMR